MPPFRKDGKGVEGVLSRTASRSLVAIGRLPASVGYPRSPRQFVMVAPFIVLCLVVSWFLTVFTSKPEYGYESRLVFHIPDMTEDIRTGLSSLFTAPLINRGPQQVLYVTILLLIFGPLVESREGSLRTVLLFFGATAAGAMFAAALLHVVYPAVTAHPAFAEAWTGAWSGGSAGAFGLAGAFAARRQKAWHWLLLIVAWESFVATFHLRNYTPAFHYAALAAGFFITRYLLTEKQPGPVSVSTPA